MYFRVFLLAFLLKDVMLYVWSMRTAGARLSPRGFRRALIAATAAFLLMDLPLIFVLWSRGSWGWPPSNELWKFYTYAVHAWHFTGLPIAAAVALWFVIGGVWRAGKRVWGGRGVILSPLGRGQGEGFEADNADPSPQGVEGSPAPEARPAYSRREMVKAALLSMPPLMFLGSFGAGLRQRGRFDVRRLTVTIPDLPAELRGLKITHISDMHVGRLIDDALLEPIVAAANEIAGDLVVVTGDIVDHNNAYLPACLDAFNRIDAPLGLYCCMGNHDHIHDGPAFAGMVRAADIHGQGAATLLLNESVVLRHRGRPFVLGGLDWARSDAELGALTSRAFEGAAPDLPRILAAHHPHAFDAGVAHGACLTLAGHTHGGQLVFRRSDERVQLDADTVLHTGRTYAVGHLMYRYVEGLYEKSGKFLFVSRGIGNWFPWRLNCPAEMTQLTLA